MHVIFQTTCLPPTAVLFDSPEVARVARADGWIDLAPPGSFG
jgi:hypothetical protein